jgi:hypothetical protein
MVQVGSHPNPLKCHWTHRARPARRAISVHGYGHTAEQSNPERGAAATQLATRPECNM